MKFYVSSKFIKILKYNSSLGTGNVINTNNCDYQYVKQKLKTNLLFSAIDNLSESFRPSYTKHESLVDFPEHLGLRQVYIFIKFINFNECTKPKTV